VLGLTLGGVAVVLEQNLNRLTSPGAFVQGSWVFVMHCFWGAVLGWSSGRIRTFDVPQPMQVTPTRSSGERRLFLRRLGAATVSIAAFGTGLGVLFGRAIDGLRGERWSSTHALPNAAASVAPVPGTRPEFTTVERHYRIDAVTRPPALNGDRWRLRVGGLIAQPLEMTLDEVRSHEPLHQFVTLACISNPVGGDLISTTRWTGVSLQRLVGVWRPGPTASHLKFISADGFSEVVALERVMADARVMLAYAWDGAPLPVSHGFPLRLYVPDVYGMKQPKWIQAVEVLDHWEPGYWVERGWDREGRMKSSAVVDVVAANAQTASAERLAPVSIGGIAHAGARGIAKVEVQVDGGEWQRAELRDPLSETTWVVWRADMPLASGDHTVTARSYEGDGAPQTSASHTKRART